MNKNMRINKPLVGSVANACTDVRTPERTKKVPNKLNEKLSGIEDELMQTGYKGERDRLHIQAKLNRKLAELMNVISAADFRPTRQIYDVLNDINGRIDPNLVTLKDIKDKDLQEFINLLHEVEIPAIVPSSNFE